VHGDVLLGRSSNRDFGLGPAIEIGTAGFDDVRALAGATLLVPATDVLVAALTPATLLRSGAGGLEAGVAGRIFLGARSYNYHSGYVMAWGFVLGVDQEIAGPRVVSVAAQVDGMAFAIPAILLYEWLRGPRG
jgi:hypothetical protein